MQKIHDIDEAYQRFKKEAIEKVLDERISVTTAVDHIMNELADLVEYNVETEIFDEQIVHHYIYYSYMHRNRLSMLDSLDNFANHMNNFELIVLSLSDPSVSLNYKWAQSVEASISDALFHLTWTLRVLMDEHIMLQNNVHLGTAIYYVPRRLWAKGNSFQVCPLVMDGLDQNLKNLHVIWTSIINGNQTMSKLYSNTSDEYNLDAVFSDALFDTRIYQSMLLEGTKLKASTLYIEECLTEYSQFVAETRQWLDDFTISRTNNAKNIIGEKYISMLDDYEVHFKKPIFDFFTNAVSKIVYATESTNTENNAHMASLTEIRKTIRDEVIDKQYHAIIEQHKEVLDACTSAVTNAFFHSLYMEKQLGEESIEEKVRNLFIWMAPVPNVNNVQGSVSSHY